MNETPLTIMVVEDEPKLGQLLVDYLNAAGYRPVWLTDGIGVVERVRAESPALVLLDLMLPGKDGLAICREVRAFSDVPIVMVTARVEEVDRLLGLEIGADDYICKPFSPREVMARVKVILRRARQSPGPRLEVDESRCEARYGAHTVELTPIELRLLKTLATAPGKVFSRDKLLDQLYEDYRIVTDRTVDSHVKNLRRKLDQISPDSELIRSVYGMGYKLDV